MVVETENPVAVALNVANTVGLKTIRLAEVGAAVFAVWITQYTVPA